MTAPALISLDYAFPMTGWRRMRVAFATAQAAAICYALSLVLPVFTFQLFSQPVPVSGYMIVEAIADGAIHWWAEEPANALLCVATVLSHGLFVSVWALLTARRLSRLRFPTRQALRLISAATLISAIPAVWVVVGPGLLSQIGPGFWAWLAALLLLVLASYLTARASRRNV